MLQECYKEQWVTFAIDEAQSLFWVTWHDDGSMTAQIYQRLLLKAKELVEQYRPTKNLSDARQFVLTISPELQRWVSENVFAKRGGGEEILKKYALVVPDSIFAQISIEQMMEESSREDISHYFNTLEEAKAWLGVK